MLRLIFVTTLVFVLAASSLAQAGRTDTSTGAKANSRPTASPTPIASSSAAALDDPDVIKVNTQLVSVPVRVMDKEGRFVAGLRKENFKVFENGTEQEISLFSNEQEPFTVVLMLDMSYSAKFKLADIQNAAAVFIDQLRPKDKVMVVSFDEDVHLLCEPTTDHAAVISAIRSTKIATGTSLYEAVDLVVNQRLRQLRGRKAVILFTDGVDTTSRRVDDLGNLGDALELDALIYTIRYDTFSDVQKMKNGVPQQRPIEVPTIDPQNPLPFPIPAGMIKPSELGTTPEEYAKAAKYLAQLSAETGGRLFEASSLVNLADAYTKIASELREFYSLAYYPSDERGAGKPANVKIKVDRQGLVVSSREGFLRRK